MYTKDTFKCGICCSEKFSIIDYVRHMILEEKCTLILQESSVIKNLLLPRFKKEETQEKIEEIKNPANLLPLEKGNLDFEVQLDTTFISEVETGFGLRWKCKICFLTFSRRSAIINHFNLQHQPKEEKEEVSTRPPIKHESKETLISQTATVDIVSMPLKEQDSKFELPANDTSVDIKSNCDSLSCNICGQLFKTKQTLLAHVKIVHSSERPFTCKIDGCFLSFKTRGSLVRHQRRHTDDRPFKCLLCGRSFRESGSLQRHKQSRVSCLGKNTNDHRYGITMPLKSHCIEPKEEDYSVKTPELTSEEASPLSEESKPAVWQQILATPKTESPKVLNRRPPSPSEKPPEVKLKKEITGETFAEDHVIDAPEVRFDEAKVLKSEMGPPTSLPSVIRSSFSCPLCPKVYSTNSNLVSHMKVHTDSMGTECFYCKKIFTSTHDLSRHMFSHSSVRQYECCQCGKTFKLKSHALSHLAAHSEEKKFSCSHCGRLFKTVSSRNRHVKIHLSEKEFKCPVCLKSFLVKASLQRHLRIHTGEKPFACPHCGRGFKEHGTLTRHLNNKMPCADLNRNSAVDIKEAPDAEEGSGSPPKNSVYEEEFSDLGSELDSYLSDKIDLSSIYSEASEMSFESREDFSTPFDDLPPIDSTSDFGDLPK